LQGRADFTKNIKLHSVQRSEQTQISRAAVNGNFILSLMRTPEVAAHCVEGRGRYCLEFEKLLEAAVRGL
jgi:hypothetical protein